MTTKKTTDETPPVVEATGVVDPAVSEDEWVMVVLKGDTKMPPGRMSRAYFDGWGKDLGWTEVK